MHRTIAILAAVFCFGLGSDGHAQSITTTVPFQNLSSSFYENYSIGWSLRGDHWFANFGGGAPLQPPFAPPGAVNGGLSGGFGSFGGGVGGSLGFRFSQGSNRSISSSSASLTTTDGYPGSFSSGVLRPFVTGVIPVVGGYPTIIDPSQIAARVGQQQLASLRRSKAARQSKKLDQYLRRGELAESEGNKRMARANYRFAIGIAPEPLRTQIQQRLAAMMRKRSDPPNR